MNPEDEAFDERASGRKQAGIGERLRSTAPTTNSVGSAAAVGFLVFLISTTVMSVEEATIVGLGALGVVLVVSTVGAVPDEPATRDGQSSVWQIGRVDTPERENRRASDDRPAAEAVERRRQELLSHADELERRSRRKKPSA
jgi:hypothetical protein